MSMNKGFEAYWAGENFDRVDPRVHAEFRREVVQNHFRTEEEGRPIYDEEDHLVLMFPADMKKTIIRKVTEKDKLQYSKQWEAYTKGQEQPVSGTAITEWAPLSKKQAIELKGYGIHTVEQLANLSDTACQNFFGARELREKAIAWLKQAEDGSQISALLHQNNRLREDIEVLKQQNAELLTAFEKQNMLGQSKNKKNDKE